MIVAGYLKELLVITIHAVFHYFCAQKIDNNDQREQKVTKMCMLKK
jgi:hypothetical protein